MMSPYSKRTHRVIVLDTETTGVNYSEDRIVEIGAVEIANNQILDLKYQVYINPDGEMNKSAEKVHGLTLDFLKTKPLFVEIADSLLDFIKDATIIAHNAKFDISFINAELKRISRKAISNHIIDTVALARKKFPGSPVNLDALSRRYSLPKRGLHGALSDAVLLAKIYLYMTHPSNHSLNVIDKAIYQHKKQQDYIPKRIVCPQEVVNIHNNLMKKISIK